MFRFRLTNFCEFNAIWQHFHTRKWQHSNCFVKFQNYHLVTLNIRQKHGLELFFTSVEHWQSHYYVAGSSCIWLNCIIITDRFSIHLCEPWTLPTCKVWMDTGVDTVRPYETSISMFLMLKHYCVLSVLKILYDHNLQL